jgi:Ca-activated chloride channel homolog
LFSFQYIPLLYLLAAIPLLALLYLQVVKWKKNTAKKIGDPQLVKELTKDYSPKLFGIKFALLAAAFGFCVFAAANLRKPGKDENITRRGLDIMVALDVSKSMLAEDIKPNRLEKAKQLVNKLVDKMGNNRVGLVIFAGRAYLQMPLTTDHGAARMYINAANINAVPTQGTVVGEALKMCGAAFNNKERKYKTVLLISDGEDHDETALEIAKELAENGAMINTVGIGSVQGAQIIDQETREPKRDEQGNIVISKLNETGLQSIANASKGTYIHLGETNDAVNKILKQLNTMEQRTFTDQSLVNFANYFQWFLLAALVLLVVELFLPERKLSLPV